MTHVLPLLPYPLDALQPSISAETLSLHHGKHHRAYVDKLNDVLQPYPQYQGFTIEELLRRRDSLEPAVRGKVRKHGGGHANHSLFWRTLAPHGRGPSISLFRSLGASFQSLDRLKQEFRKASERVFGSGWVFLSCRAPDGAFQVMALPNQDSPWSLGATPLLAFDLWEHAYYLQYRNDRSRWLDAWWEIIDWDAVELNLGLATGGCVPVESYRREPRAPTSIS